MTGKELKDKIPALKNRIGYRSALMELQLAGLSESTARQLLTGTYEHTPRHFRALEAIETTLSKFGLLPKRKAKAS
jgi:hypothetical protein